MEFDNLNSRPGKLLNFFRSRKALEFDFEDIYSTLA